MFRKPFGSWHLNGNNWQLVFASKVEVALIAAWHGHDCAGSVAHQDVVGNPHRYLAASYGVGCKCSGEHASFLARVVLSVDVLQCSGCFAVSLHRVALIFGSQRVNQRMLWREHHEGCAEQCVGAGSEHFDWPSSRCKLHSRTGRPANPIALHQFQRVGPVQAVKVVVQAVGVFGDAHHPLTHVALEHGVVANVAAAFCRYFFVGKNCSKARAPVDRRVCEIDQAMFADDVLLLNFA